VKPLSQLENHYFPVGTTAEPLSIFRVARERFLIGYELSRVERPNGVLLQVVSGSGYYRTVGSEVRLRRGMLFTYCPGQLHEVSCPDHELEVLRVTFSGPMTLSLLSRATEGRLVAAWSPARLEEVREVFRKILRLARALTDPANEEICLHYLRILVALVAREQGRTVEGASASEATFRRARQWLERDFRNGVGVLEAARACGIRYEHLSRLFRRYHGMSASQYLTELRMTHAADLLVENSLSVTETAERSGYADAFAFSKAFKRHFGVSPSQFGRSRA